MLCKFKIHQRLKVPVRQSSLLPSFFLFYANDFLSCQAAEFYTLPLPAIPPPSPTCTLLPLPPITAITAHPSHRVPTQRTAPPGLSLPQLRDFHSTDNSVVKVHVNKQQYGQYKQSHNALRGGEDAETVGEWLWCQPGGDLQHGEERGLPGQWRW